MIEESTYVPFQDGLLTTPPYNINEEIVNYKPFEEVQFDNRSRPKCEYCGKPAEHANCHAHKDWCPYYCNPNPLSLGNDIFVFSIILTVYILIKKWKMILTK